MFRRLDESLRNYALEQGAEEVTYPVTIPLGTLQKSKFFSHYPQFANFISVLKSDTDNISAAAKKLSSAEELDFLEHLKRPVCMCRSAGCLHAYPSFEGQVLRRTRPCSITMIGRMFRNEGANIPQPRAPARVQRAGDHLSRLARSLCASGWPAARVVHVPICSTLKCRASFRAANDPFFADNLAALQFFPALGAEQVRVSAHQSHDRQQPSRWASVNMHAEHFSKAYNIKFSGRRLHSDRLLRRRLRAHPFPHARAVRLRRGGVAGALREFYFGSTVRARP